MIRSLLTILDMGEAAAIALSIQVGADLLLMDERRGRAAARRLGVPVQGTLGVLLRAKRHGAVDQVGPLLTALLNAGFWISDPLVGRVLEAAGESRPDEAG